MRPEKAILSEFIENAIYRLDESMRMVQISLNGISEEELWQRPNTASNSIANILLHLCGNITQYAISSLGERPDIRERALEFSVNSGAKKNELLEKLTDTVLDAKFVITHCSLEKLLHKREVQGFSYSGIGIIIHVVEHFSYHTGQIAFWVKQLKNKDLEFHKDVDLSIKNKD